MSLQQSPLQPPKFSSRLAPRSTVYTALFLCLLAVYLLTYTPRINSSDGLAMFSTAESIIRRGALDIEQVRWLDLQQGTYGLDGLLYSRKGIGVPVGLLPLTWLGLVVPWLGTVSLSLLFNAIVTALTAVLILGYLHDLGFSPQTGLIVALLFGLTTLAWPYAKSLFSDPFSGLLLLAAAYTLLKFHRAWPPRSPLPALRYPLLAGLFLGWNVATRYAEALFLPVFGLLLLYYLFTTYDYSPRSEAERDLRFTIRAARLKASNRLAAIRHSPFIIRHSLFTILSLAAFLLPLLLVGLGLIAFNLSRYGDPFNTGYLPTETFSASLWQGLTGQLFSPGRGLLLYCPIFILSFFGLPAFFRRFRPEAILALAVILIHLFLYGKWFMWHGGFAWGPRFMIPTLPFWALFLAPVVARAFPADDGPRTTDHGRLLRLAVLILAALSLTPQLLAIAIDFTPFQGWLLDAGLPLFHPQTFFDPRYSPLLRAWSFIRPEALDLAWAWQGRIAWWLLAVLLVNIAFTGFCLYRASRPSPPQPGNPATLLPCYLATLITVILLLIHTHSLPPQPLQQAMSVLNQAVRPTDAVIINQPDLTLPFAELYKGRAPVLGVNHGGEPLPADLDRRLDQTLAAAGQVWWLPNWLPPADSAIEQTLLARGFRARDDNFDGQRLLLFAFPFDLNAHRRAVNATFGRQITLAEIAIPSTSPPGAALPLELQWQAQTPVKADYVVFIHLLDAEGQLITQADGQPVLWTRPTSTWAVGERIVDRHGLWLPPETRPGTYSLRIGLYQSTTGQRLQTVDGTDSLTFEVSIQFG
ncbi:MAG: hypothetical protein AB1801_04970, partial [Chloroflexota bacterium]